MLFGNGLKRNALQFSINYWLIPLIFFIMFLSIGRVSENMTLYNKDNKERTI